MFTELIRKGKWSYMFLAAVATLAVAALATLANTRTASQPPSTLNHESGKTTYGSYTNYNNGASMRFIN
jgi:hypothetical protein